MKNLPDGGNALNAWKREGNLYVCGDYSLDNKTGKFWRICYRNIPCGGYYTWEDADVEVYVQSRFRIAEVNKPVKLSSGIYRIEAMVQGEYEGDSRKTNLFLFMNGTRIQYRLLDDTVNAFTSQGQNVGKFEHDWGTMIHDETEFCVKTNMKEVHFSEVKFIRVADAKNILIKERLDLPPNIRYLDRKIEGIELELRKVIVSAVENKPDHLPSHLLDNARQLIQRALIKNAPLDAERYDHADGILEYFDLREIQHTILSKALWDRFSDRFKNKEVLEQRFSQLAELRNDIRHSRTVDDITRKDGEASIIWFERILAR